MQKIKYWKSLGWSGSDYYNLQQQITIYLRDQGLIHDVLNSVAVKLDIENTLAHVPKLAELLDRSGYTARIITMFKSARTFDSLLLGPLMGSFSLRQACIEIPVIGCDYSVTRFYHAKLTGWNSQKNGLRYKTFDETTAELAEELRLTEPVILRHVAPHNVSLERTFVTRISLRVTVDPDPVNELL
jgi:hypothetical protein